MAAAPYVPERGDFVGVALNPHAGAEQSGERPALILTRRTFNAQTGYALLAPITLMQRGWPFEVPIPAGAAVRGVVLADQTKSIDWAARHVRLLGQTDDRLVTLVLERLTMILQG